MMTLMQLYEKHHHVTHIEVRMAIEERERQIELAAQAIEKKAYVGALMILKHGVPPNEQAVLADSATASQEQK